MTLEKTNLPNSLAGRLRALEHACDRMGWVMSGSVDADRRFVNIRFRGVAKNVGREVCIIGPFDTCTVHVEHVWGVPNGPAQNLSTRLVYAPLYRSDQVHLLEAIKQVASILVPVPALVESGGSKTPLT